MRPRFRRSPRRRLTAFTGVATLALLGACGAEEPASDELYDFSEPETTAIEGSTPYDTYVLLVERAGVAFLEFPVAEERAQALCLDPYSAAESGDEYVTDLALLRAYCPELAEPD
jgi:hypothetical protein